MYSLIMVDDEIWTLRDVEVLIREAEGFYLQGAYTNPIEAEKAILANPPDVVLTDLKMEEMSGQQLMRSVHEHCPDTRIIILSAYRDFDAARDAIKFDVVDYILKPIVKADFLRALSSALTLLNKTKSERTSFAYQRSIASHTPWSKDYAALIKEKAPFPCHIETGDDAYARIYYDYSEGMDQWIRSLDSSLGFSREYPSGSDDAVSKKEALAALCAGFVYTRHEPLDRVQSYIALNCHEKITLNRLAEEFGFASAYLCDLFRKKCGIQLFAFIRQVRIDLACHLLCTTSLPVHTVSAMVGYEDNSHFCREFKSAKGVTPNAYRRAAAHPDDSKPES